MNERTSVTESVESVAAASSAKAILVLVCIALFFAVLEASAVSVILPEIAIGVSADTAQIGWLMTGFLLETDDFLAVPFQPWQFDGKEEVWKALILTVIRKLERHVDGRIESDRLNRSEAA